MITAVEAAINEAMIRRKGKEEEWKKKHFTNGKDSNMWKKNLW